jgi:rhomboid protease GluP
MHPIDPHPPPEETRPVPPPPVRQKWPPISAVIIGGSVALFVLDALLTPEAARPASLGPIFQWIALYGPAVQDGQYWRVLSCVFSHGGPIHLLFNMMVAYQLGMPLERSIGSWRFLLISLVTALGSSAFALLFNFDVPTVGASGMIIGYGGAMLVTSNREFRQGIVIWLVQVAIISLLPGVSWAGHLGGFLFGIPMGLALRSGPRVFKRTAPLMLAIALVVVFITAHPERFGGLAG